MTGSRWTSLVGVGLRLWLARRARWHDDRAARSRLAGPTQTAQLRALLAKAAHTEIGRERGFAALAGIADDAELRRAYRATAAPADYEGFRERLVRARERAQPDVTWPGVVRDWAQTSGTTGGEKYIPVSADMMRSNYRAALDCYTHAARMGMSLGRLFGGRILFLGGSTDVTTNEHGVRTGDLSGLVTRLIRWPISAVYSPGKDVALMSDWPKKIDAMADIASRQDIRAVSGMASWSFVLFEKILQRTGKRTLAELWPNFELFIHGGVRYPPFDAKVRRVWSGDGSADVPNRLEVYPASEGFIATQDTARDPGLRLHVDTGIYYEFIPLESIDDADPPAFACDEVEPGRRYVVCMTTCAGLWRYVIGDVVEFDTVPPAGPPRLRIVGRHRHFINAFGENLIVEEIEHAVVAASAESGVAVGEFTAAPRYPGDPAGAHGGAGAGLSVVIEWPEDAGDDRLARFSAAFDAALRAKNVDYNTKRSGDLGMSEPGVHPVPQGTFHAWMASRGKLGGQHKCPRCANHREYLDGVLDAARSGAGEPAGLG